jgi:AraC-like DNA-binding protein
METLSPDQFRVRVRLANHHAIRLDHSWERSIIDLQFLTPFGCTLAYRDEQVDLSEIVPGQVLCIEPGIHHWLRVVSSRPDGRLAGIHCELHPSLRWGDNEYRSDPPPTRITVVDNEELAAFRTCAEVFESYHRFRQALSDSIATGLIIRLAARWTGAEVGEGQSERIRAMLAYVRENAALGCTRHDLARVFSLTPEHVNWLFRRELGTTPGEVVQRERCRIAYRLLHEEGASVSAAAAAAGYEDPFHFSRVFHKLYGMAPSRVR